MLNKILSPKATATVFTVLLGALVGLALPGPSAESSQSTNNPEPSSSKTSAAAAATDTMFAKKAAQGNLAEVKLGQLAQEKGQSQAVKDFGKRMVDDHSKANEQLQSIASQDNIALPNKLSPKDQQTYDRLMKLNGSAFDRAYAQSMVADHQEDISEFQREADRGGNPQIKDFASNTLPTLQSHLDQAKQMQSAVSSSASNRTGQAQPGAVPAGRSY